MSALPKPGVQKAKGGKSLSKAKPSEQHSTPYPAPRYSDYRSLTLCFYDTILNSLRIYPDGSGELVTWVDKLEFSDSQNIEWADFQYLVCSVSPSMAKAIEEDPNDFSFGDIYLEPGAHFQYEFERFSKNHKAGMYPSLFRTEIGTFQFVNTEHLPANLSCEISI